MSATMNLAMQFTAIDLLSGVVTRIGQNIKSLGDSAKDVKDNFDDMTGHVSAGLKSIAVGWYGIQKAIPGVQAATTMQEAMLKVKANLGSGAKNAQELDNQLRAVKKNAMDISANAPFAAEDVVLIENALLKAGLSMEDVGGKSGAAWAATALASLTGEAPAMIGDSLARIGSQFKIKGSGYGDLSDWIVRVDDATASSVPELIQGLRMSGSAAAQLGISAKDSLTTLGALAPLGERAGSSYNNMLIGMLKDKRFFKDGQFIGMAKAIEVLKEKYGGIENSQKRLALLMKVFGEEGGRAAGTLLDAAKGFNEIEQAAKAAYSIQQKMDIWSEGFGASLKKLAGTSKTALASMFDPMLGPLTKVSDLLNNVVGKTGDLAETHKTGVSVGQSILASATGVALGYGAYRLAQGAIAGRKVLAGMGGLRGMIGSTIGGVAAGKVVEEVAGVKPVFVTNWPAGFGLAGAGGIPGATDTAAAATSKLGKLANIASKTLQVAAVGALVYEGTSMVLDAFGYKGEWGAKLFDLFNQDAKKSVTEVNINIDQERGRVTADSNGGKAKTTVNNRGGF